MSPVAAQTMGAGENMLTTMTATVQSVDLENRMVTLKDSDGRVATYNVAPEVVNLPQVKPGDRVDVSRYEAVAIDVTKAAAGSVPMAKQTTTVARAEEGGASRRAGVADHQHHGPGRGAQLPRSTRSCSSARQGHPHGLRQAAEASGDAVRAEGGRHGADLLRRSRGRIGDASKVSGPPLRYSSARREANAHGIGLITVPVRVANAARTRPG